MELTQADKNAQLELYRQQIARRSQMIAQNPEPLTAESKPQRITNADKKISWESQLDKQYKEFI
jgi:hypothetical protein